MPTEEMTITSESGNMKGAPGTVVVVTAGGFVPIEMPTMTPWRRPYLSAEDDPLLAELWDNDDDAVYDSM